LPPSPSPVTRQAWDAPCLSAGGALSIVRGRSCAGLVLRRARELPAGCDQRSETWDVASGCWRRCCGCSRAVEAGPAEVTGSAGRRRPDAGSAACRAPAAARLSESFPRDPRSGRARLLGGRPAPSESVPTSPPLRRCPWAADGLKRQGLSDSAGCERRSCELRSAAGAGPVEMTYVAGRCRLAADAAARRVLPWPAYPSRSLSDFADRPCRCSAGVRRRPTGWSGKT
jgi:hypothetical protein